MNRIVTLIAGLSLAFFILTSSVMLTLTMKWTYQLSRNEIVQVEYYLDDATMVQNYNGLIDYMFAGPDARLSFEELPMSPQGEFHFWEVKNIFQFFFNAMLVSAGLTIALGAWLIRKKKTTFLNLGSLLVFLVPAILAVPVALNFEKAFILFHEIAFSNDYWIFDPVKDPIIRYLPESLFLKNTVIILLLIVAWIVLVQIVRVALKRRFQREKL